MAIETSKEEKEEQQWQLKTKQLIQIILKIKIWRKKLAVNASYINNMEKVLTT